MWYEGSFQGKGKKKSSPFRQNGTERLRDRLTGPHAAHLPGCQEFRFTLGGTSPSTAISHEGQTAFTVHRMRSSQAPEASLCAMMSALPKPPPIPRLCPHSQSKIITLYYRLQKWASKHSPTGLHPERRNAPEWAFMTARFHFRHSRPAVFAKKIRLLVKSLKSDRRAGLKGAGLDVAAVQRWLDGKLRVCLTAGADPKQRFKDVRSCCLFFFNEFTASCRSCCRTAYIADRHLTFRPRAANAKEKDDSHHSQV